MNAERYSADKLVSLLRDQQVATMPQLKSALGTDVTYTVLRRLAPLGYRSSFLVPYSPDLNPIENMWSQVK